MVLGLQLHPFLHIEDGDVPLVSFAQHPGHQEAREPLSLLLELHRWVPVAAVVVHHEAQASGVHAVGEKVVDGEHVELAPTQWPQAVEHQRCEGPTVDVPLLEASEDPVLARNQIRRARAVQAERQEQHPLASGAPLGVRLRGSVVVVEHLRLPLPQWMLQSFVHMVIDAVAQLLTFLIIELDLWEHHFFDSWCCRFW